MCTGASLQEKGWRWDPLPISTRGLCGVLEGPEACSVEKRQVGAFRDWQACLQALRLTFEEKAQSQWVARPRAQGWRTAEPDCLGSVAAESTLLLQFLIYRQKQQEEIAEWKCLISLATHLVCAHYMSTGTGCELSWVWKNGLFSDLTQKEGSLVLARRQQVRRQDDSSFCNLPAGFFSHSPSIYSFHKHLWSTHCMPDTELGPTAGTNLGQIHSALKDFQIQWV